ncbi:hypothetical protein QZN00_12860 [Burkholderia multivorans]|nr:hypothetical protein [Burkholderia multivorans]
MDRLIAPNTVTAAQADTAPATGTPGYATDGNPASNIPATRWPAYQYNAIQEELMAIIAAGGLMPDRTNNAQVAAAITRICLSTAVLADTGAANAYAAANTPPLTVLPSTGFIQRISIAHANTGASTYAPDGLTAKPIYGLGLQPLQGGELVVNGIATLIYLVAPTVNSGNGAWILLGCTGGTAQLGAGSYGVTPPQFDNSTKLATTAFVQRALGSLSGYQTISGSTYSLTAADVGKLLLVSSVGATISLPPANSVSPGAEYLLYNSNAQPIALNVVGGGSVVVGAGSVWTIDGTLQNNVLTSVSLPAGLTKIVSDGANYWWLDGLINLPNSTYFSSSLATNGYQKLPSGLILQWGNVIPSSSNTLTTYSFPIAFPTACLTFVCGAVNNGTSLAPVQGTGLSTTQYQLVVSSPDETAAWIAIGY